MEKEEEISLLMACYAKLLYLDTGCCNHVWRQICIFKFVGTSATYVGPLIQCLMEVNDILYHSSIDDFSQKIWIYFLHEKFEALTAIKSFKALTLH